MSLLLKRNQKQNIRALNIEKATSTSVANIDGSVSAELASQRTTSTIGTEWNAVYCPLGKVRLLDGFVSRARPETSWRYNLNGGVTTFPPLP